jgi:hypothetical protein
MKKLLCIFIFLAFFFLGCSDLTLDLEAPEAPSQPTLDELVVENCRSVRAAAEAYAAQNGGENPTGRTVQDYLPEGRLLENPYTHAITEPVWGAAAASPGQTGYVCILYGESRGYTIDGIGSDP